MVCLVIVCGATVFLVDHYFVGDVDDIVDSPSAPARIEMVHPEDHCASRDCRAVGAVRLVLARSR